MSVAVINDGVIEWVKKYGVAEAGTSTAVTPRTLFQAASISKPVAAAAALKLVEQGKLALDEPVNARLVGWKVPDNEFTAREKVTLRRLLNHSAGLTVHGFGGYPAGRALLAPLAGRYELRPGRVLVVALEGDTLFVIDGLQRIELFPQSPAKFFELVESNDVEFVAGADGKPSHMLIGGQSKAMRLPDAPAR